MRTNFSRPYGIRSLSKYHEQHPYVFRLDSEEFHVGYRPAESDSGLFGGNSNWRGPGLVSHELSARRGAWSGIGIFMGMIFGWKCPRGRGG